MGLFSKILTKLGIKKAETATTPTPNIAATPNEIKNTISTRMDLYMMNVSITYQYYLDSKHLRLNQFWFRLIF